jgi:hypothetical protein
MTYVYAHMDADSVLKKMHITNHLVAYAQANFEEVSQGSARLPNVSLSCLLVEWYLSALGIRCQLDHDVNNIRYVYPQCVLRNAYAQVGDVVFDTHTQTVEIAGGRVYIQYSDATRTCLTRVRTSDRHKLVLNTHSIQPNKVALVREEVYVKCTDAYTIRDNTHILDTRMEVSRQASD